MANANRRRGTQLTQVAQFQALQCLPLTALCSHGRISSEWKAELGQFKSLFIHPSRWFLEGDTGQKM